MKKYRKTMTESERQIYDHAKRARSIRIRTLMAYRDLTLARLSEKTGISVSTLGMWLRGRQPSDLQAAEKFAAALGISVEQLLKGSADAICLKI